MTVEQGILATVLIAIGVAGARGLWVFGYLYKAMELDRNFWRDRALDGTGLAEIAADVAEGRTR